MLSAVDSINEAFAANRLRTERAANISIVKENLAVQIKRVSKEDMTYPSPMNTFIEQLIDSDDWLKQEGSSIRLRLNFSQGTHYIVCLK